MKKVKVSFMVAILIVTLCGAINLGVVELGKETGAYSLDDTVFASGMDLMFAHPYYEGWQNGTSRPYAQILLDVSVYDNTGFMKPVTNPYSSAELTWGKYGKALDFDGSNDYITIDDDASLDFFGTHVFTLMAWVNPEGYGDSVRTIIEKRDNTDDGYALLLTQTGTIRFKINADTNDTTYILSKDEWCHVAATYDGTYMRIYINGELSASELSGGHTISTSEVACIGSTSFAVGGLFNGTIDEVRIYPIALTQSHIKSDMLTPINQFRTYGFYESLNFTGFAVPEVNEWTIGTINGITGFSHNEPNLPWIERPAGDNNSYRVAYHKYVAGFKSYRMYATVNWTTDYDAQISWSFTFFRNGISERTFRVQLTFSGVWWGVTFTSNGAQAQSTNFKNGTHPFRVIVDAWIGDDDKHFTIRVTCEHPVSSGDYSLIYSYDLQDRNNNIRRIDWFDGWVLNTLAVSHTGWDTNDIDRMEIVEHGWVGTIAKIILIVVVGALAYQWALRPVLEETTGLSLPKIPVVPERPDDVVSALGDLAHQITGVFTAVGNAIVDALSPIITAIMNIVNPLIQGVINFMSDVLTALINVATSLWDIIVSAIDALLYAIFPGLGPNAFSTFLTALVDFLVGLFSWIASSLTNLVTFLTSTFSFFGETLTKMFNTISTAVGQWVTMIQNIWSILEGGYGQTYNIFETLRLDVWIVIFAIFYPLFLYGLWEEKGFDAMLNHLEMVMNILAWIFRILLTVVQSFITVVTSIIEALPGE